MTKFRKFKATPVFAAALFLLAAPALFAQKEIVKSRVTEAVDDLQTVRLRGNVHPLAKPQFDQGALPDSQPMERMLLLLQRSAAQETSLRGLLDAQQTKNSGSYHAWLTPDSFGTQFGPSDSDMQAVTDWLTRQGFQVSKVAAGRSVIEFSGTAGQVRKSFQTEIHRFLVNGEEHFANVSDPAIPQALTPVVAGVVALHNFRKTSHMHSKGIYRRVAGSGELRPLFTYGTGSNVSFAMGPADFNTVYNVPAGATGAGQTIAVVGRSNINAQDIIDFRNLFGLPQNFTQAGNIIVNGPDPGILGPSSPGTGTDEGESDLDVEWAGAIAPNAKILFVTSQSTQTNFTQVTDGTDLSSLYVVDNNIASVMTDSYGSCERGLTTVGNQFSNNLWEQAAAQGITVTVASGDTGSAACDPTSSTPDAAVIGLAVTGEASTPFNVAVGGTDFDPSTLPTAPPNQYWNANNTAQQGSALKYIPEVPWDTSLCAFNFPTACTSVDAGGSDIAAAGGGLSACTVTDSNGNCTASGYARPSWQTGLSTAATRAIPDVSLFASNGGNGVAYIVCQADNLASGASCSLNSPFTDFGLAGGTSFSTPAFAGIMALVNEKTGQRQGNANYVLYALAASDANYANGACGSSVGATPAATCVYNDVTKGNISVACAAGTPNCSNTGTTGFGILTVTGIPAYTAGKAYDLATGLGSINVTNLLNKWASVTRTATTTNLASLTGGTPSGTAFSATVSVVPASAAGDVSLTALASDGATVLGSFGPFTLASGTVVATTNLLPPGTAFIEASYGGDATHALSTSAPVALTVAGSNQVSKVALNFVSMDNNGNITGVTTSAQKLPYGSEFYILNIVVTGTQNSGQPCGFAYPSTKPVVPCPTGKITLTDNGTALNDFPNGPLPNATNMAKLNNLGLAEDQPINLAVGAHSVVASYAGDPNYQANTSNALSITFTQTATTTTLQSVPGTVPSGGSVTITATVNTTSNGVGPTGTVQFANATSNIGAPVTCTPTSAIASASGTAFCTATLTTTLSALPPATPVNRKVPPMPILPITLLAFAAILYLASVQSMQQGRRRNFAYAGLLVFALLVAGVSGCGGGGSSSGGGHTVTINASYVGDTNYTASSGSTTVLVQ